MYASPPIEVGQVLADKYQVQQVLGSGGMGVVVAARHLQLGERVAIKFLQPHALLDADTVARFEREARIAVKIKSEHVARTLDVGQLDTGSPYIVMEYLEGTDLSAMLRASGPLSIERAVDYVLQACEALAEAHALGIVHRDLKPANLFVTERADGSPCVKLLDFGISKLRQDTTPGGNITHTHDTLGSPLYMSPEQLTAARDADHRSDIWSLGVIVYQLLGNQLPFDGTSLASVSVAILSKPVPPLREACPEAPEGLVRVVERALEKDAEHRYQNLFEWARALAPYGTSSSGRSVAYVQRVLGRASASSSGSAPVLPVTSGVDPTLRLPPPAVEPQRPVPASRRRLWGLSALAGALSVAALLAVYQRSGGNQQEATNALLPPRAETSAPQAGEQVSAEGAGTQRGPKMASGTQPNRDQAPTALPVEGRAKPRSLHPSPTHSSLQPSGKSPASAAPSHGSRPQAARIGGSRSEAPSAAPARPRRTQPSKAKASRPEASGAAAAGSQASRPESEEQREVDVFQHRR